MPPPLLLSLLSLLFTLPPLALVGCGDDPMPIGCQDPYLGDEAAPMELELFALGEDLAAHEVDACGPVDIVEPPQGGRVLFIGVRGKNLDPCDAKMAGGLRDPRDEALLGLDGRSTIFRAIPGRAGWGRTEAGGDTTNGFRWVANIPVCPNMSTNPRDVQQQAGIVEISITDKRGKRGTIRRRVFPRCAQPDSRKRAMCECLCQQNYTLDKCKDVMSFPESPDAGACFPMESDGGSDGGSRDGAAHD